MADAKITALTANTAPISTDLLPMVDDPGGTPATQKVTFANAAAAMVPMAIVAAAAKATPVDADSIGIVDSEAANVLKETTWTQVKAFLKTYYDTIYTTAAAALSAAAGIKLDDFAAPDDNTDLNASTTKHGLLLKLSNTATEFLNGAGSWATPAMGGVLAENTSIGLDPALSADGKFSGVSRTGVAGYAQAFGELVYLDPTDSRWEKTDANAAAAADGDARGLIGMVVVAGGSDGAACTILLYGNIRADSVFPALTPGAPVYVSESAGVITQTQPTTTDAVIRTIGFAAEGGDEMVFQPAGSWITHV